MRHTAPLLRRLCALALVPLFSFSILRANEPIPSAVSEDKAKPSIDILLLGYYIWAKPAYVELMKKEGINIYGPFPPDPTAANPENYPVEYLKKFHIVIASGPLENPWDPQVVRTVIRPGIVANLLEYNRQGGGVIWTPLAAGFGARSWTKTIGNLIDAVALDEALDDPSKDVSVSLMASFRDRMRYIRTSDINPDHPVTESVRGLFFGRTGEWGWPATVPMKFGPSWDVLVRGMDSTRTTLNGTTHDSGKREYEYTDKPGTYTSHPELIAVRKAGDGILGRMMLQPIYTAWTWGNYGHPATREAFLLNGDGLYPSDGQRFLVNSFRWLAAPAQAAGFGGFELQAKGDDKPVDLSPVVWNPVAWDSVQPEPAIRGIFGAFSKWGGGKGTVEEWAAAARAAGLDYVVFTDDPAKHTPETYKQLVEECKKNSDDKFAMVPGWGAYDINGVFRFYPGALHLPNHKHFNDEGRLVMPVGATVEYGWTVGQVPAEMGKMPYNPWWEYVVMACAPLTYDGGKLTDDSVMTWLHECEPNQMNLLPMSLVRVKNPAQLGDALKTAHATILRSTEPADVRHFARKGAGGGVLPSYLTNGPEVLVWRNESSGGEPFRPASSRFRILLKVASDVGLAEVKLVDAVDGSTYRDWKPNGAKEFAIDIDETTADQRVLGLFVTDVNGHTAIAPPINTLQGANRLWQMSDRLMALQHTSSWNQDRTQLVTHGSPNGVPYVKGHPDGGGEFTTDHIDQLKIQGLEGSGIYPPAFKIEPSLDTSLGKEPTSLAMRYERKLAGHDLTVIDYVGDQQYKAGDKFVFDATPRVPTDTQIADVVSRAWNIRTSYRAPVVMTLNEITVTFKKDAKLNRMHLARYRGPNEDGEFNLLSIKEGAGENALFWTFNKDEKFSRKTDFKPGGYLYQGKSLAGTMGFIALDDKITVESEARGHSLILSKDYLKDYKAGDVLTIRMLRVSRAFEADQGSNEWLEKFIKDYGIATKPAYPLNVSLGKVKSTDYVLDLEPQGGGAIVELGKYDLPQPLPVRVSGMKKNAILGEYDLDTLRVRPLPFFEGSVTTSIETQLKDNRLYVGEWLTWDNDEARVSLVPDGVDFALEVHNPTDKEITCVLNGADGFTPLKGYRKEFQVPAHTSIKEKITSAADSVKLEPMR